MSALEAAYPEQREEIDQRTIATMLHALARTLGWRVHEIVWRDRPMTFHWADVEHRGARFAVLIGADARFLALSHTQPRDGAQALRVFDDAAFTDAARSDWPVLRAADLDADLTRDDRAFLAARDARMPYNLDYWRPRTVGAVIFNWWD